MFQVDERLTSLSAITVSRNCDFMWFPPRFRGLDPTRTFGGEVSPKGSVGHSETQLSTGSLVFNLGFISLLDDDDDPDDEDYDDGDNDDDVKSNSDGHKVLSLLPSSLPTFHVHQCSCYFLSR